MILLRLLGIKRSIFYNRASRLPPISLRYSNFLTTGIKFAFYVPFAETDGVLLVKIVFRIEFQNVNW